MKKILTLSVGLMAMFATVVYAQPGEVLAEAAEADLITFIADTLNNAKAGHWSLVASSVLIGLMLIFRRVRARIPFFQTDRGGAIATLLLASFGSFAVALSVPGVKVDGWLILSALQVALGAIGGFTWFKKVKHNR